MEAGIATRVKALLAALLGLCGMGCVVAASAPAATGYRLAFGSSVYGNPTAGPLIIHGHRGGTREPMMADQLILHADGSTTTRADMGSLIYEEYPGSHDHRHWHYKRFVRYQLRSASDLSVVRRDNKAGFCLSDAAYAPDNCGYLQPEALDVHEGLGPDRTDYYSPNLEGQWIDVQDVPPGDYWLVHWVNSAKEICESDYSNDAAAVKIALWPNGYGRAPYFRVEQTVAPFPSLFKDLAPPAGCGIGSAPAPKLPDLVMWAPAELSVTPGPDATPALSKRLGRRYAVLALTRRFHRRPHHPRVACRRLSRGSVRCSARWSSGRYAYRGKVRIFTARKAGGDFERRFDLRVRRTDTVCAARDGSRCSRTIKANNVRLRLTRRPDA